MKITIAKMIGLAILVFVSFPAKAQIKYTALQAKAQTWAKNTDKYPDLKTKGVYVVMNDTISAANKAYWHIYQTYWTYSKVIFLPYADMDKYLQRGNYFFTITRAQTYNSEEKTGYWEAYYSCSLSLWKYKGKSKPDSLRKEKILNGKLKRHVASLAGIALFSAEHLAFYSGNYYDKGPHIPKLNFYTNYDYSGKDSTGKRLYFNWSEGLLKNYLQGIMWYAGQKKNLADLYANIYKKEKMDSLKHDTLFIPDFTFVQYGMSGKYTEAPALLEKKLKPKTAAIEEKAAAMNLFEKYKYPYKLITSEQLSKKLLYDPKPFHYLLYVLSNADKQITIVNSDSGENIFFTWIAKPRLCSPMPCPHTTEVKLHPKDIDKLANKMAEK